jgi:hypothetical protein
VYKGVCQSCQCSPCECRSWGDSHYGGHSRGWDVEEKEEEEEE